MSDHKEQQWAKLLGGRKVSWYRQVRKCRKFRVEGAERSQLYDFLRRVESIREEHGTYSVPVDVRNKTVRVKSRLGHKPSEEDIRKEEAADSGGSEDEEEEAPAVEDLLYACVDCDSNHTLDENYQCPDCGQDYCHDCVELEKDSNCEGVCNRCLERWLRKCSICLNDRHLDCTWFCPGCGTCYCHCCNKKKDRFPKTCENCCEQMCSRCPDTASCGLCKPRPFVVDLVDSD